MVKETELSESYHGRVARVALKRVYMALDEEMYKYIDIAKVASYDKEQSRSATNLIRDYVHWVKSYIQFLASARGVTKVEPHEVRGLKEAPKDEFDFEGQIIKTVFPAYYWRCSDDSDDTKEMSATEASFLDEVEKNVGNVQWTLEGLINVLYKNASDEEKSNFGPATISHKTESLRSLSNNLGRLEPKLGTYGYSKRD